MKKNEVGNLREGTWKKAGKSRKKKQEETRKSSSRKVPEKKGNVIR